MMDRVGQLLAGAEVEWRTLGEVADISRGVRVVRRQLESTGLYPVYQNALAPLGYLDRHNCPAGTVFVIAAGAAGQIGYSEVDFCAADDCFRFHCHEGLIGRFLYYWLLDRQLYLKLRVRRAAVPRLPRLALEEFFIPIPPLPVQAEIVRILDTFTKLEAELEAELEDRMKQYAYYRDQLLTFGEDEVEWKTLGEVGDFVRGQGLQKKDFTPSGVGCVHYGQIYTRYGLFADRTISFVSEEAAAKFKKAQRGDLIITTTSENLRDVCKTVVWEGENPVCVSAHAAIFRHEQNPRYLAYYTLTKMFTEQKRRAGIGTMVIEVSVEKLRQFRIPIPSLARQAEIVGVLDRLHALSHSLMDGLPAELRARRKQYEHYRERLLTFNGGPDGRG